MYPRFLVANQMISKMRLTKDKLNECVMSLRKANSQEDIDNSLGLISDPYLQRSFCESAECLRELKLATKRSKYKPIQTLEIFVESAANDAKPQFQTCILEDLVKKLGEFDLHIKVSLEPKKAPISIQGSETDSDDECLKEYDDFIQILQEYSKLGEDYFLKDIEEGAIKDTTVAINMKKKQFDSFIDNTVNKMINEYREARKSETHERICKRSIKLSKVLTHLIIAFPLWCVNPGLAILSVIIPAIINKNTDSYYRTQMATELKTEERILEEKIKDADSMGDKGKKDKIKLMRLKDKVSVEREQVERGWA